MFYRLWLKRMMFSPGEVFQLNSLFSVAGLILGVAVLTIALSAVNGFSRSLQQIIVDQNGHLTFTAEADRSAQSFLEQLKPHQAAFRHTAPFLTFEGLISHSRELKGVLFEGLDLNALPPSAGIRKRILRGSAEGSKSFVILGQSLAEELNVDVGGTVQAVVLEPSGETGFSRKKQRFAVGGIADFGKHDLNSRYVVLPLPSARKFLQKPEQVSGVRIWLKEAGEAGPLARALNSRYGDRGRRAVPYTEVERTFFDNINSDKRIIFFVLLILIISAGFNVSISLFAQVFKKTREISILKAMGASDSLILRIFLLRGLVVGLVGAALGIGTGVAVFRFLLFFQNKWDLLPEEIYQVSEIVLHWKARDLILVFFSVLFVVLSASLFPARRACRIPVKEGLSYE